VDVSDLDSGEKTLYVRARDNAGRWSSKKSMDFNYYPDATPEISLTIPNKIRVIAGNTQSFDVKVENTGELLVKTVNISAESKVVSGTEEIPDIYPSESINVSFDIETQKKHIGVQAVTVKSDYPSASKSFNVRVEANENQQANIDSKLSEYKTKLENLRQNAEEQKPGIDTDLYNRFQSNFSDFEAKISSAEKAVNNNQYYKAQDTLENIDESYNSAQSSFDNVVKIDQERDQRNMIMMALLGIIILGGGAGGFLLYSDEYALNLERIYDSDIDINGIEGLKARIDTILSSEEEAEEFEWNGFK
jgi:hypothetical protein